MRNEHFISPSSLGELFVELTHLLIFILKETNSSDLNDITKSVIIVCNIILWHSNKYSE